MKGIYVVYRKELYRLFASPIFYVVAFIFLALVGFFFYSSVASYSKWSFEAARNPFLSEQLNLTDMVLEPWLGTIVIVLLFIVPLLTMRLFAEEKKTGTVELLFTYPISDRGAVLGKFTAGVSVLALLLAATLPAMFLLEAFTDPPWPTIMGGYLGLLLMGSAFVSLGLLASSLTENQIIAAVITFGGLLLLWVIGWAESFVGDSLGKAFRYISLTYRYENFARGILDSRDFIYYLVFIILFLFITLRILESRQWRG